MKKILHTAIATATGVTDPTVMRDIEDFMGNREARDLPPPTLIQLRAQARKAWEIVSAMRGDPDFHFHMRSR